MKTDTIETASKKPRLDELKSELESIITNAHYYYSRAGLYYDTRYCLWAGQSDDGRKNADDIGEDPFPWDGASDTRVRLADKIIKERKRLKKLAFFGKQVQARPIGSHNAQWAAAVNPLLKWLIYVCDPKGTKRELNLAWSFQDCYGAVVMATFWRRETRLREQTIRVSDLAALVQQSQDPELAATVAAMADPLRDEQSIALVRQFFPDTSEADARRALETLRLTGEATLDVPMIAKNVPRWVALRPYVDVFFDAAVSDIQDARVVFYREFITETALRDREGTEGYDKTFIAEAIKQKNTSILSSNNPAILATITRSRMRPWSLGEDTQELIELQHAYYKVHEKNATAIYCTTFHPDVSDHWAKHERLEEYGADYPFDVWCHEEEERAIMESRGVPEIVLTWQGEQKLTRDFHADRMSLDILPPLQTPRGHAGQVAMGPAQQLEQKRGGEYKFLAVPPMSQTSLLFNAEIEREINEYFGRGTPTSDPIMVQAARQELATDALIDLVPVISRTFRLAQRFLSDQEIELICGRYGVQYRVTHADIQGEFDIEFTFDVRMMDPKFIDTFGNLMKNIVVPLDRAGTVDFSETVAILLQTFDPSIAERVQRRGEGMSMSDVNDEQGQIAKMLNGIEPPAGEVSNPQLRLQVLMNTIQSSPTVQGKMKEDETVRALLENRAKMLQFSLAQMANADTGRTGVQPVLGGGVGMNQGAMQ